MNSSYPKEYYSKKNTSLELRSLSPIDSENYRQHVCVQFAKSKGGQIIVHEPFDCVCK